VLASDIAELVRNGSSNALLWGPQASGSSCSTCLWTDTRVAGGGQATANYDALRDLIAMFPAGTTYRNVSTSSSLVRGLASPTRLLLVNTSGATVKIQGVAAVTKLAPLEVRVVSI